MKFRPLHDRVLVESLDSEEKTSGGIIIPDTAKEKPQEGKVIAVGFALSIELHPVRIRATLDTPGVRVTEAITVSIVRSDLGRSWSRHVRITR